MIVENIIIGGMQKNQAVKKDGISTTLTSAMGTGGGYVPMIVQDPIRLGGLYDKDDRKHQVGAVWDKDYLAPTIDTMQGGNRQPMILTPKRTEYGKEIRKSYEKGEVKESRHNMTQLEPRKDGICNTLTTVQKDNLVLEPTVAIKQATKKGYIECKIGGVADLSYPTSKLRRGRVQGGGDISPTLTTGGNAIHRIELTPKEKMGRMGKQATETFNENNVEYGDTINPFNKTVDKSEICPTLTTRPEGFKTATLPVTYKYRIRKLTPLECWRLMGFTDEDFSKAEKVNSNSQLYRQAGNSIVVQVLEAIFKQMEENE